MKWGSAQRGQESVANCRLTLVCGGEKSPVPCDADAGLSAALLACSPCCWQPDLPEFKGCSRCSPPTQGAERCVMGRFATTQPTCSHTSPSGFVVTERTHAHTRAHTHTNTHYPAKVKTLLMYNIINYLFSFIALTSSILEGHLEDPWKRRGREKGLFLS